jgi:hypothetical protein
MVAAHGRRTPLRARLAHAARSPLMLMAIALAGYAALALMYVRADRAAADLQFRADASRAALRRAPPDPGPLEAKLAEAEARLEAVRSKRVLAIPEEVLVQHTLRAAAETGVAVTSAGTRSDTFVQRGGERVRATPFFVRATGTLEQIEAFLAAMERGQVDTLEVQSALVTEEGAGRALTLSAVIYSHMPLDVQGPVK